MGQMVVWVFSIIHSIHSAASKNRIKAIGELDMPQIFIDGQEYKATNGDAHGTLGELLAVLVMTLGDSRKMISELILDGISISEDSLPEIAHREPATARSLMLKTMTYKELARLGSERTVLLLQQIILEATQSAELFRSVGQEQANRSYAICLEDLQLSVEMTEQLLKLEEEPGNHENHQYKESVTTLLDQLAPITGELLSAHRRRDAVVLADVLTYELVPLLHNMRKALQVPRNHAAIG
jgi:hypothetical protein